MHTFRRLTTIALATAAALTAAPALAGSHHGGVGGPPGPEILPPNAAPGQCFTRRVTGPGGAYRWDRTECDSAYNGYSQDQWGYGGGRLDIQTQTAPGYGYGDQGGYQSGYVTDCGCGGYQGAGYQGGYAYGSGYAGDRYGERRYDGRASQAQRYSESQYEQSQYGYESNSYDGGYAYGRGGQGVNYPPSYGYGYVAAGRDEAGYLIWPGKAP